MAGETAPRLVLQQEGAASINTRHLVLIRQGDQTHELDAGVSGNYDCSPYKPESFYWRLEAQLHRVDGRWVVLVVETEEKHRFEEERDDWVTTRREQPRVHLLTDEGWIEVQRGEGPVDPRWGELVQRIGPGTRVAKESRG